MSNAEIVDDRKFRSLWGDVWVQFRSHKGAMLGVIVFSIILFGVTLGPYIWTADPQYLDIRAKNTSTILNCFWTGDQIWQCFTDPKSIKYFDPTAGNLARLKLSWSYPLGTDQLGRDQLAQLLQGGRVSMAVGMAAMLLPWCWARLPG